MKLSITASLIFAGTVNIVLAQTTLSISPGNSLACPGVQINYQVQISSGSLPSCTYTWTVARGHYVGLPANVTTTTGTAVSVIWDDTPGSGTLSVLSSACSPSSENGKGASATYAIRSVFGKSFSGVGSPINVPFCNANAINLIVDHMYIEGTGGIAQPPLTEIDAYIWSLPADWKQYGTNATGVISTVINSISIYPTTNCASGSVLVQGP